MSMDIKNFLAHPVTLECHKRRLEFFGDLPGFYLWFSGHVIIVL